MKRIIKSKYPGKKYGFRYILECNFCHKDFDIKGTRFNEGVGKFCSHSCRTFFYKPSGEKETASKWKGGRIMTSEGYVLLYSPEHPNRNSTGKGYMLEHRLVMEKKIGRHLLKKEVVHHLNRIRDDNRPENLELMSPSSHMTEHWRLRKSL